MSDIHNPQSMENSKEAQSAQKSEVARREEAVLAFWNEHDIFNKSVEQPAGKEPVGDFVFYDGPPFATGLPHYGHILAGTIKDAIPRFWTMNGYRVVRKWGWDCHGLPLENLIEKRLGLATKRDIEELGVKEFNEAARGAVLEYADDWKKIVPRMGRFVDMENDYKTMDPAYTETVWWVFSELNKKGLVYEGFKSMHLCPRCGTTLSNFEVNQGYKDIKDIAVTVRLPLVDEPQTSLLVWTTTPWTLPGNMAAAVHKDADYVEIEKVQKFNDKLEQYKPIERIILAKKRWAFLQETFEPEMYDFKIIKEFKGKELLGKAYVPPFDYWQKQEFEHKENAWKIYHADYVEVEGEGTGAVHLAPAYGEEDMLLAQTHKVPIVHHVDSLGRFKDFVTDFAGLLVKPKDDEVNDVSHLDTDIEIVKKLSADGKLFRKENVTHSYPHCWRCETPLLNFATTSWFVRVTELKDKLVAENEKIHWVPEHVGRSRFGKWLEGARDWAISRQRYWGAPLPIWRNPQTKGYKVLGSLDELKQHVRKSGNTYLLMRHGESESNVAAITSTKVDDQNALTATGREQVREAIPRLQSKQIDLIIASPFLRTKKTAEMIAEGLNLSRDQVVFDDRLGEINLGEMDGVPNTEYHDFLIKNGGWHSATPPRGESWGDVKRRVGDFLYEIDAKYSGKTVLIIAHNCPLRMLGVVNDGDTLLGRDFDHDDEGKRYGNAEIRELPFTPLPHNDNYELDFHRPYIDEIELYDTDGTKLERVPDVFDCWFESGSMPYGQNHYPFENTNSFEPKEGKGYPANFISESIDQTRGWFYSLIVLGTALFGKSPYQNVVTNGLVLAEDGRKMSKSLQNYPDPMELVARQGADSMRYYLLSSPIIKGEDLNFSEKEVQELQRKNIGRLHNVLLMYETYTDERIDAKADSDNVLDRWILARLNQLIEEATEGFKKYELDRATRPITDFIDDLSVWYLRRSRDRLKGNDVVDRHRALVTLRYVLKNLALVLAPSMPFYAEYLFQRVKERDDAKSVHLMAWPNVLESTADIIVDMAAARDIVTKAHEARAKAGIKVRQPVASVTGPLISSEMQAIILDEVNAKAYVEGEEVSIDTAITPELKAEGDAREFMRQVQDMRKKMGLEPKDRIHLAVRTSEGGEAVLRAHEESIKRVTGADSLSFDCTSGEEITVGDHSFTVSISKI